MEDYKVDILNTRKGCLGGSDAKMLFKIALMGYVPQSCAKRMAVCKGLVENENVTNRIMQHGDFIEQQVYEHLLLQDDRWQSNPCLVSVKYSRPNVKCIDHVDLLLQDDKNETLVLGEVKASKFPTNIVRQEYKQQLCHHLLLGREYADTISKYYKVKLYLFHYNTNGVDFDAPFEFDPERLTVEQIRFRASEYTVNLNKAMDIVDKYLEGLTEYYEGDEVDSSLLPERVRQEFDAIATCLAEIKEREQRIDEFKQRLFDFMTEKGIKSIKNDEWGITRVDPSESVSFDYKAFLSDYAAKYPRKVKKLMKQFEKRTAKKGYVNIKLKTPKKSD